MEFTVSTDNRSTSGADCDPSRTVSFVITQLSG